jgi:AraC-like DNA-binding protein
MTARAHFVSDPVMSAIHEFSPFTQEIQLHLFAVGSMALETGKWNARNVRDSFWRFYVNDRDGASLILPNSECALRANRLYFVPENVLFSCANRNALGHFFIHFDVLGVPRPVLQRFFAQPVELEAAPQLQRAARALARDLQNGSTPEAVLQCRAQALLFAALAHSFTVREAGAVHDFWELAARHEAVAPALEYIEAHLSAPLNNEVLARRCHWSADHFARRFRECVGQTPAQYVQARRIAVASQQLLFTEKSIEQIAQETGFADRFHFSRVFALHKQYPPAAYRKRTRV